MTNEFECLASIAKSLSFFVVMIKASVVSVSILVIGILAVTLFKKDGEK